MKIDHFPRVSIVVPTRDRPEELVDLLLTIFNQSQMPFEVVIVDDSPAGSGKQIVDSLALTFKPYNFKLKYINGSGAGLTTARNLGIKYSEGDAILFLDDDTLLDRNTLRALATFLRDNSFAIGVQPKIVQATENLRNNGLAEKFENALYKVSMLSYHEKNKLTVRRSGASIFPNDLIKVVSAERMSGCCCYRREVFTGFSFDTNLKRWGFMEDLDFSYRVYRKNPNSLYAIPNAKVTHKKSTTARLPLEIDIHMATTYWFYVFFKDIFQNSILNLLAFQWALIGNLIANMSGLAIKRKPKKEWWGLIYLLESYVIAFRNLRNIRMLKLEFFNKNL